MAEHNETRNGLNETERLPRTWSRSTVADGQWMQKNTLGPYRNSDWFLAGAIDGLLGTADALSGAIDHEAEVRATRDTELTTSANDLYIQLAAEVQARKDAVSAEAKARSDRDTELTNSANDLYAGLAAEVQARKDAVSAASGYLDNRINGVSATFNTYSSNMNTWAGGIDQWQGEMNTWKGEMNTWKGQTNSAIGELESAIAGIEGASDVYDVVATTADLNQYTGRLTPKAIIKVLSGGTNNDQQVYYRWNHDKTAQGTWTMDDFDYVGGVQAYYDKGYIDNNYYKKTDLYTKTEVNTKLGTKLDTSAQTISAMTTKTYSNTKYVDTLNGYKLTAPVDGAGNNIVETYAQKSDLNSYATKTYVNGTFASASNVYAKNATSGKEQLNTAFGNKLDASAAFKGELLLNSPAGGTRYDLDTLWFERRFSSEPEELKLDNDQEDLKIYAYPMGDSSYSARKYIGTFKLRKELYLANKELAVWTNTNTLPDFENFPNRYFII